MASVEGGGRPKGTNARLPGNGGAFRAPLGPNNPTFQARAGQRGGTLGLRDVRLEDGRVEVDCPPKMDLLWRRAAESRDIVCPFVNGKGPRSRNSRLIVE